MATVYFDQQFASHVNDFCNTKNDVTKKRTFTTNYDFMIFAALIGRYYHDADSCSDIKVKHGNEIPDRVFYDNSKEGVAYLLALDAEKTGDILKEETDKECWKYLEQYAFLGCEEIAKWISLREDVNMNINDVILNKIKQIAAKNIENRTIVEGGEPEQGDRNIDF